MTFINNGYKLNKRFLYFYRNSLLYNFIIVSLMFSISFLTSSYWYNFYNDYYNLQLSFADFLILQKESISFFFIIIPLFLLTIQLNNRNNFNISFIIRKSSREDIWIEQIIETIIITFLYSGIYLASTLITSQLFSKVFINWDKVNSLFYLKTKSTSNVQFINVVIITFIFLFFTLLAIGFLFLLLNWTAIETYINWVFMLTIIVMNLFYGNFIASYTGASISYKYWLKSEFAKGFLILIMWDIIIFFIGIKLSKCKEFFNEV